MASFDRAIPPGGEGKIILSVRTRGYRGAHRWTAKVTTDDANLGLFYLETKAFVHVPVSVSANYVYLNAKEGRGTTKGVVVRAGLERPLTLETDRFSLEGKVSYRIEEIEKGKTYRVLFEHIPSPPGSYRGFLSLRTNYPEKPEVTIQILGRTVPAQGGSSPGEGE
ncbi:MAG: hypothetical protein MUO52_04040 [Desulfobacterales bacterium]|nr:hypothetical protein [Desulfobacterales bacterium]